MEFMDEMNRTAIRLALLWIGLHVFLFAMFVVALIGNHRVY